MMSVDLGRLDGRGERLRADAAGVFPGHTDSRKPLQDGRGQHCDYFSLMLSWRTGSACITDILAAMALALWGKEDAGLFRETGTPISGWHRLFVGPEGVTVKAGRREPSDGWENAYFESKGEAFEALTLHQMFAWVSACGGMGVKIEPTRIDWARNDCEFTPLELHDLAMAVQLRTQAQRFGWLDGSLHRSSDALELESGRTFHVGKRGSARYVRCYDRRGHTRLELELRREKAEQFCNDISTKMDDDGMTADEAAAVLAPGYLADFMNFIDRGSDSNISRCSRLPFWDKFLGGAKALRRIIPRLRKSVAQKMAWAEKIFPRNVAFAVEVLERMGMDGWLWMRGLADKGARIMTPWQRVLLDGVSPMTVEPSG